MGCTESRTEEERLEEAQNSQTEKLIKEEKKKRANEVKLLLLGTGESGKSTIAKQMRILHQGGFSGDERAGYKALVHSNTIISMATLLQAAAEWKYDLEAANVAKSEFFLKFNRQPGTYAENPPIFTAEHAANIQCLWKDPAIQKVYERRSELQLFDNTPYYFKNVERFASADFLPDLDDVLRVRAKTSGVLETAFTWDKIHFKLIDVGGQRSERRKWIHCFEEVTALIYCIALNEYDLKLAENLEVNRMKESLELFGEIANSKWFLNTALIIFLNKWDLFEEKIKRVPMNAWFPEYQGGSDSQKGMEFIQKQFVSLVKSTNTKVFAHVTCATSTENVRKVFADCKEIIITENLSKLGFNI